MDYIGFRRKIVNRLRELISHEMIYAQQMQIYDNYVSQIYSYLKSNEQQELLHYLNKFDVNKFEIFSKVIEYEFTIQKDLKKINLIREAKRIDSGLVNTKIINKIYQVKCENTYGDFLRALKLKSIFFVKAELNGTEKVFLAKADIGKRYFHKKFGGLEGWHNLLLDPVTLDVYQYNRRGSKKIVLESYHRILTPPKKTGSITSDGIDFDLIKEIKKEVRKYIVQLKKNYIKHYSDPLVIKKESTRQIAKKKVEEIFSKENIKKKLGITISHSSHKLK